MCFSVVFSGFVIFVLSCWMILVYCSEVGLCVVLLMVVLGVGVELDIVGEVVRSVGLIELLFCGGVLWFWFILVVFIL